MDDLSPRARAVFDAAWQCPAVIDDPAASRRNQLAAALRVVALIPDITRLRLIALAEELEVDS